MKKIILFICFTLIFSEAAFCLAPQEEGKKVILVGEGVTGTWAAAKISQYLSSNDQLIIISPPKQEIVKNLGNEILANYTTSSFIPIGIQIEMGVVNLSPPNEEDVKNAKNLKKITFGEKLYISHDLDSDTQNKLDHYIKRNSNKNLSAVLMRYHRDVCFAEWKKYMDGGGKGAEFSGPYILAPNRDALVKLKDKLVKNRVDAGYDSHEEEFRLLTTEEMTKILPNYSHIIQTKQLNGLGGFNYDGRVTSQAVIDNLHQKISSASVQIIRKNGWVSELTTNSHGKVTGIKLRDGSLLKGDVVVLALGQGATKVLASIQLKLPILKKWGAVYALPKAQDIKGEQSTIIMKEMGIVRDMPRMPTQFAAGEWILPEREKPNVDDVFAFVNQSSLFWTGKPISQKWLKNHPIYVQPRPMTLDGLPVLDSKIGGLVIVNPSGSQGNTQAPGSALFAASKVMEQLGRKLPADLKLPETVEWKEFELYPGRF